MNFFIRYGTEAVGEWHRVVAVYTSLENADADTTTAGTQHRTPMSLTTRPVPGVWFDPDTNRISEFPFGSAVVPLQQLGRLGRTYRSGLRKIERYWPTIARTETQSLRSQDVVNRELPFWWTANLYILAHLIQGRAWTATPVDGIEGCLRHFEILEEGGIIKIWYGVGISIDSSLLLTPIPGTEIISGTGTNLTKLPPRNGSLYASRNTLGLGNVIYTDMFTTSNNRLHTRTPNYDWLSVVGNVALPANFDPENPT